MKNFIEKLTMAFSVFSPIVVLILVCGLYLRVPDPRSGQITTGATDKKQNGKFQSSAQEKKDGKMLTNSGYM